MGREKNGAWNALNDAHSPTLKQQKNCGRKKVSSFTLRSLGLKLQQFFFVLVCSQIERPDANNSHKKRSIREINKSNCWIVLKLLQGPISSIILSRFFVPIVNYFLGRNSEMWKKEGEG